MKGRAAGRSSVQRTDVFSGGVWSDPVFSGDDVVINSVFFEPGALNFWHWHERGQILLVTSGEGRAQVDGEDERVLSVGDVVWVAPGERHWHGAGPDSYMVHIAISLGKTNWEEQVERP